MTQTNTHNNSRIYPKQSIISLTSLQRTQAGSRKDRTKTGYHLHHPRGINSHHTYTFQQRHLATHTTHIINLSHRRERERYLDI